MRLFVSYARIDKAYCIRVVDVLNAHTIWYDQRLYAGQNWWAEISRRLDWCDGFVYLLSPDSLASEYCKREFEIAQSLGKPIIPILIHKEVQIPEHLLDMQYIDLSNGLTVDNVKHLLDSIYFIEQEYVTVARGHHRGGVSKRNTLYVVSEDEGDLISRAVSAMHSGNYDQAIFLLNRIREIGVKPRFINVEALLEEAELALKGVIKQREIERDYEQISQLMKLGATKRLGCEAFLKFRHAYPDYDPENLAALCSKYMRETTQTKPLLTNGNSSKPAQGKNKGIVPLDWCKIPGGMVKIDGESDVRVLVDTFYMSKYPITNAHYQAFIKDPKGYNNISWWNYSGAATEWRLKNPKPVDPAFQGANRPREHVTWYDAMAYCRWLSRKLNMNITLPTLEQRRRAIQGDDDRAYPWGNEFDKERCNSRESEIRMTTVVNRYDNGISPCNVYDLVGNVWEWCLNDHPDEEADDTNLESAKRHAVHGGAFLSHANRCHVNVSYHLISQTLYNSIGFRVVRNL